MVAARADREALFHLGLIEERETTRVALIASLRKEWGDTEETAFLLDYLQDAWATLDQLTDKVGAARALTLIFCEYNRERPEDFDEESEGPQPPMEAQPRRELCRRLSYARHMLQNSLRIDPVFME